MGTSQSRNRLIGGTALVEAAEHGDIDLVRRLIAEGADVNDTMDMWDDALIIIPPATALMVAAANGHTAIVELLLAAPGIDVNAKNRTGGNRG